VAGSLCLVVDGHVQLIRTTGSGRRLAVATLGPGSIFGEESLLGGPHSATSAMALEHCTLWFFPARAALEISSTNAMFGFGLMQAMGQRLVETENRLEQVAYSTISSRLAAQLLELSADGSKTSLSATHQQLADMLGTWRETVSKTMKEFRQRGLVASAHRRLILLDIEGLKLEAGGVC
jgi:CRP-like cAMP-binding protein